jgi:Uma2 family endonuclease
MASIAQTPTARYAIARDAPNRVVIHDASWEFYENLRADDANRHLRMSFDDGELELMSPSPRHSSIEFRFGLFVVEIARKLGLKCKPLGNATWKKPGLMKGKEADGCFYFANFERIRKKEIDLEVDPPPDLAIEVEVSRSAVNALSIYAAIGVPEIWRFDGTSFQIHQRQADGGYLEVDRSPTLPFLRPDEVMEWLIRAEELDDDMEWIEQVGEWVLNVVAPRLEQH